MSPLSLVRTPSRLAADGLDDLQGAVLVATFAVAGRLEDQFAVMLDAVERLDALIGAVTGLARVGPWR
jgi:hypothetical protein